MGDNGGLAKWFPAPIKIESNCAPLSNAIPKSGCYKLWKNRRKFPPSTRKADRGGKMMMKRVLHKLQNKARRWRKREEGATAVEFALIAMVFFWVFMGIVELGMMMIFNNGLEDGVDRAARLVRTGQADKKNMTAKLLKQAICERVMLKTSCMSDLILDIRSFKDFASIKVPALKTGPTGSLTMSTSYQLGGPKKVVVVRAFYPWKFFTPLIGSLMHAIDGKVFILNAAMAFRNEPYGS